MWGIYRLDYWLYRLKMAIEDSYNYRPIQGFEDYRIRVDGKIKNKNNKTIRPFWIHGQQYVNLYKDGQQYKVKYKKIYNDIWV